MHELQGHILKELMLKRALSYSQLKPKTVEGNHFTYHLNSLVADGLVKKNGKLYTLAAKGKRLADRMSMETFRERIQPKIVTLIACTKGKQTLLYKRGREPFLGLVGFPYGKIHLGEKIADAAKREVEEKAGVSPKLSYRGDAYIMVYEEGKLVTQMLCHVFSGTYVSGELTPKSVIGVCFWGKPEDIKSKEAIPGFKEIASLLRKSKKPFFEEFVFDLNG